MKGTVKGLMKGPVNDPVKEPTTKDSQKKEVTFAKVVTRSKLAGSSIPASRGCSIPASRPSTDLLKEASAPLRLKRLKRVGKNS